ncbi:D-glycero-beta-D-manno-heptose 1-phosphate adenylyltransferase [Clavibacter zhangzhiyongii]|uniref:D-glycero-beta-D-manno-heptose 1-phosphate adenylyltransferase n=1 Tax=Clavibacter TaxID=1573 RepID=UPI0039E14448
MTSELRGIIGLLAERRPTVTVIGDVILDEWWRGHSDRMTREAPAPVVDVTERIQSLGGAANTAVNLASLGGTVRMVGLVGQDAAGDRVRDLLVAAGVDVTGLVHSPRLRTTTKTRIVGDDQVIVRVDDVHRGSVHRDDARALARAALEATAGVDAEIVSDYGTGTLHGVVLESLAARSSRPGLTVVDAHDPAMWAPLRPDLITPNAGEAGRLVDRPLARDEDRAAVIAGLADTVLAASGSATAVVTLDRDGTVVLGAGEPYRTRAHPVPEKQASGAGDTFVAALTLARAVGLPLEVSADFAQAAADVVVRLPGTSVCSAATLADHLGETRSRTVSQGELVDLVAAERAASRRIVFTNGCFDVLHRGHTTYLRQAKRLGDVLVVALNSDDSVRRLKGSDRPVNTAEDRAGVLAELSCVDVITVFDTDTPIPLIEAVQPDVYAKGGDYTPEMLDETAVVRAYGGEVSILGYVPSQSTTSMVDRIRASAPEPGLTRPAGTATSAPVSGPEADAPASETDPEPAPGAPR